MTAWTTDELNRIGKAEELEIASVRRAGTRRDSVTIWVVRHGRDLYVRSVNGRTGAWFRRAQERHEARIEAGGVKKDVLLVETDDVNDAIDAAYRTKYRKYAASIIKSVVSRKARSATIKLVARPAASRGLRSLDSNATRRVRRRWQTASHPTRASLPEG